MRHENVDFHNSQRNDVTTQFGTNMFYLPKNIMIILGDLFAAELST